MKQPKIMPQTKMVVKNWKLKNYILKLITIKLKSLPFHKMDQKHLIQKLNFRQKEWLGKLKDINFQINCKIMNKDYCPNNLK